ncbi:proline-rich protein 36-like [Cavia porcellus]|uniref:proline-rich protein 36-like n=1 Tax=Cavia porcellus TaxID=10141 RepID=UPI002FE0E182
MIRRGTNVKVTPSAPRTLGSRSHTAPQLQKGLRPLPPPDPELFPAPLSNAPWARSPSPPSPPRRPPAANPLRGARCQARSGARQARCLRRARLGGSAPTAAPVASPSSAPGGGGGRGVCTDPPCVRRLPRAAWRAGPGHRARAGNSFPARPPAPRPRSRLTCPAGAARRGARVRAQMHGPRLEPGAAVCSRISHEEPCCVEPAPGCVQDPLRADTAQRQPRSPKGRVYASPQRAHPHILPLTPDISKVKCSHSWERLPAGPHLPRRSRKMGGAGSPTSRHRTRMDPLTAGLPPQQPPAPCTPESPPCLRSRLSWAFPVRGAHAGSPVSGVLCVCQASPSFSLSGQTSPARWTRPWPPLLVVPPRAARGTSTPALLVGTAGGAGLSQARPPAAPSALRSPGAPQARAAPRLHPAREAAAGPAAQTGRRRRGCFIFPAGRLVLAVISSQTAAETESRAHRPRHLHSERVCVCTCVCARVRVRAQELQAQPELPLQRPARGTVSTACSLHTRARASCAPPRRACVRGGLWASGHERAGGGSQRRRRALRAGVGVGGPALPGSLRRRGAGVTGFLRRAGAGIPWRRNARDGGARAGSRAGMR